MFRPMNKTHRVVVRIERERLAQLRDKLNGKNTTLSSWIRRVIQRFLNSR